MVKTNSVKLFTASVTLRRYISSRPRLRNGNRVESIIVVEVVETVTGVVTPSHNAVTADVVSESVSASSVDVGVVYDSCLLLLLLMMILLLILLLLRLLMGSSCCHQVSVEIGSFTLLPQMVFHSWLHTRSLGAFAAARGLCPYLVRGRSVPGPEDAVPDERGSHAARRLHWAFHQRLPRTLTDDAIVRGSQEKTEFLSVQQ